MLRCAWPWETQTERRAACASATPTPRHVACGVASQLARASSYVYASARVGDGVRGGSGLSGPEGRAEGGRLILYTVRTTIRPTQATRSRLT